MPKFKVKIEQFVSEVAEIEVEAESASKEDIRKAVEAFLEMDDPDWEENNGETHENGVQIWDTL